MDLSTYGNSRTRGAVPLRRGSGRRGCRSCTATAAAAAAAAGVLRSPGPARPVETAVRDWLGVAVYVTLYWLPRIPCTRTNTASQLDAPRVSRFANSVAALAHEVKASRA